MAILLGQRMGALAPGTAFQLGSRAMAVICSPVEHGIYADRCCNPQYMTVNYHGQYVGRTTEDRCRHRTTQTSP
jgi:hypothetical protein